ncbi:MAG: CHASE2 domain-containing protein [Brasilonema sp.]
MAPTQPIDIFLSCSHTEEDEELRNKLESHLSTLRLEGEITIWHARKVIAGTEFDNKVKQHLNSAHIILLLISPDFFNSREGWDRYKERDIQRKADVEARIIPILLRSCDWKIKELSDLQPLPRNGIAITSWENQDDAFKKVAEEIRKAIENKSDDIRLPQKDKRRFPIPWRSLRNTLFTSVPITVLVIVMRVMGIFEASELLFFNSMMRNQQAEEKDSNILLVEITADDRRYYDNGKDKIAKKGASLPDKVIFDLLNSLINKEPRVIGLDISRDFYAYDAELSNLFNDPKKRNLLIFVCKSPYNLKQNDEGDPPPPGIPIEQVGLSDLLEDSDGVIRRQFLTKGTPPTTSKCRNQEKKEMESFSFKVAQKYLAKDKDKNLKPYSKPDKNGSFKSGNTVLQPLDNSTQGGYNRKNDSLDGYQILLNYRSVKEGGQVSPQNIAVKTTVQKVLSVNGIEDDLVKDKIVLIGRAINDSDKRFHTPFSSGGSDLQMEGLYFQAQMVSQLVSAVSDEKPRPLLKVSSITDEILLIIICSIVGSILPQLYKKYKYFLFILGGSYLVCIISFLLMCFLFFSLPTKRWIPLFSPSCAFTLSVGVVIILVELQSPKKNKPQ